MKKGIMVIFTVGIFYIFFLLFCGFSHNITLGNQASLIIKNDQNETFFESCYQMDVLWTELNNLPDLLVEGTVAVEDKRFYQHHGYDPIRIMKALYKNLVSQNIVEGASTITQQTIKNLYLTQEKTYSRKIKELFLSVEAELHYTKEDILETYFNTLYYGHGIYGIQNASQFYFNKNPNELTLAEIAMLIGIPNSPNNYSPYLNDEKSRNRQLIVLNVMRNQNLITDQQYTQAKQEKLMLADFKTQTQSEVYGYYKDAVLQECRELGFCSSNQDHITIYTYYDEKLQKTLQNEFDKQLENTDMQAAGIIMEPYTFHIKAIQGGSNYYKTQYNRALYSKRQSGSTIKALLYYLALVEGFNPSTCFDSTQTTFQISETVSYTPENYRSLYAEMPISLIHAISTSDNVYAIKTHLFLGTDALYNALNDFGIQQDETTVSMALGTTDFPLIDLAMIYNTFASEGLWQQPAFIKKITDAYGNILHERKEEPVRLLKEDETLVLTSLLRAPFDIKNVNVSGPSLLGYEPYTTVAAKSGSSDWDSLIVGYNPQMTLALWNGYDENKALTTTDERKISRSIFKEVFNAIYSKENPGPWYTPNDNILIQRVNPITGQISNTGSLYWYLKN
ncbi:MAG: transglycosylase domain-containing protein [Erysipelotrichaceae bacterium]|nr:transglycosylase domain-containing protein [Erysipelotrichaceae bacterium]